MARTWWRGVALATGLGLALATGTAGAQQRSYNLVFGPEATGATGTGSGRITVDGDLIRVQFSFSGLSGTTTASHIHCCTASSQAGTAGVATRLPTFGDFPLGVTAGAFDRTFDMLNNVDVSNAGFVFWNPAFVTASGSVAAAKQRLIDNMDAGKVYVNIHTSTFGGGEIRAFTTPEPGTWALLATGLGALALGARRRRSRG